MKPTPQLIDRQPQPGRPRCARVGPFGRCGLVLVVLGMVGCQGGTGVLRRWGSASDATLAKPISADELGSSGSLVSRWLNPKGGAHAGLPERKDPVFSLRDYKPTEADKKTEAEVKAAIDLFQQGDLPAAEKTLERITSTLEKKRYLWDSVNPNRKKGQDNGLPDEDKLNRRTPWGEKALFYLAESQYQQGGFVRADLTYQKLLNLYPASPHLDTAVKRQFAIATAWFAAGDPKAKSDRPPSWLDHFNDRMPLIDVDGGAVRTMEHVRQQDSRGPLADKATMAIADHYMKKTDYENAAAHYDQLITDYPKSELLQKAQLGSIDAHMKGYLGPNYDSDGLEKAKATIGQTLNGSPVRQASVTTKLYHDLDLIADQEAEIAYGYGQFYKRTGWTSGAEFYFGEVRARWPKSKWAEKAKVEMASLAKAPRKQAAPSRMLTLPGAPDPYSSGNSAGTMGASPGGGMMGMPMGTGQ